MQVKLHMCSKVSVEKGDVEAESLSDPTVVTGLAELESRGGHGQQVAQIDVTRADGQIVRFWIKARANNRGQVECEVACDGKGDTTKRKSVLGTWFTPRGAIKK
jgi:hypothetical protein